MSLHDALIQQNGVPSLWHQFADEGTVTIELNGVVVLDEVDAILKPIEARDELTAHGVLTKRMTRTIDVLTDVDSICGLKDDLTNATAIVSKTAGATGETETWAVESVGSQTPNMQRLELVAKRPRNRSRSGITRET